MNFYIDQMKLLTELAKAIIENKGIQKITNESGFIVVPMDKYSDFCHDIGIILGRVMCKVVLEDEK